MSSQDIAFSEFSPVLSPGSKLTIDQKVALWNIVSEQPDIPSPRLLEKAIETVGPIDITICHLNRIRTRWGKNRKRGRPSERQIQKSTRNEPIKLIPNLESTGVHLFSEWMEHHDKFSIVLPPLKQAINQWSDANPEASFPLLSHKDETLLLRFKALFYAPLMDIGKLTEFDYKEHCLSTLIGQSYQSSTLNQYLGQLERVEAGVALQKILVPEDLGEICYIDGHMIAFWSTKSMHKGKITMLGRIMAGSHAVVAHDENGQAIYVEYHPPDIRLPAIILEYCGYIVSTIGTSLFVIDREVNSEALAAEFESRQWGLLSMLDRNQYKGLSDWEVTYVGKVEEFGNVYKGQWSDEKRRLKDPRHFVIVENGGKLLPYWGTSPVEARFDPLDWPKIHADRTEIQENAFKRGKSHGALEVNYGTKKIIGPDRHRGRVVSSLEESHKKVDAKIKKNCRTQRASRQSCRVRGKRPWEEVGTAQKESHHHGTRAGKKAKGSR